MKNLLYALALGTAVISCSKSEMQQTSDTIKSADSLFTRANDGVRTLDSISKIVRDTAKFNKIVVPEIEKTKESVGKVIQENAKSLDSLNAVLKNARRDIQKGSEVLKTVDSAGRVLKETSSPIDVLSTISKTIDKVSKSARQSTQPEKNEDKAEGKSVIPDDNTAEPPVAAPAPVISNPVTKNGVMEVTVYDLSNSRDDLALALRRFDGNIVSEKYEDINGDRKQVIRIQIPTQYFDEAATHLPERLGTLTTRSVESTGTDYDPNRISSLEFILREKKQEGMSDILTETGPESSAEKSEESASGAFMKGFDVLGKVLLALLPFWPVAVIGAIIWYFMRGRNRNKKFEETASPYVEEVPQEEFIETHPEKKVEEVNPPAEDQNGKDPYEKYRPK
ncbi:DUF4349 domain-containing protein [Chryseobacterium sp.]|uniref:DUF4349 domain-containing protein n=1 Tax=Chryseobacterium sp. TaxID=1871047 RepID=UPI0012A83E81|nr:DUF4349 domain-containing protein [Chryseobacterium sp.]QFG53568.1 DUF4349 domain-containing protein [Chryseobacterium sp.]